MSNKVPLAQATKESRKLKSVAKPKDMILDPMGQWKHPGENTRIPSNEITMQGVPYPVLAKPNVGQPIMMQPGAHYTFPGADYVDEFPKFAGGGMVEPTVDENGRAKCPDGYDYNSSSGYCEKKSSKCPDGYKPDGKGGCIEDRCQPGYIKDASGTCVPDTSGATYVEDENDPRYQDYLTRRKLHHISNIENPELRYNAYYNMKKGYNTYDQFYDPEKGYTFDNIKTEDGRTFLYDKDGYPVSSIDNIDPTKGDYNSKRDIYKGLTINQAKNLEAYARSKGFDLGDRFDPYSDAGYEPDQFTEKYKPSKFDANVYYINSVTPNFSFDRSAGKYLQPDTAIVEDKINRERLKKYYPNITDEDINDDYASYYNSYISNIKDDYNSLWPQYSADPEIAKQTGVLAADDGSDITMDEHKKNIQDSAKAPNVINAPLNVEYDDHGNPIIKGRRTSYKPENVQDWINSTGRVLPYYDAPTDNYKFITQPKSAELIQETQRAVPKYDEPELNLKENNLPVFTAFGPLKDRKHIHYNNPFIVGTSNKPLNWAPYSAALRAFTGYKKGDEKKLNDEVKAAREEGRPVNFEGIPLMGKTDLKHRRAYKKGLKEYEKRQPAIELENEKRRQQYEEQLKILNLQRQAEEDKRNKAGIDPNAITEWKKGGGLKSKKYSRSLQATNRLFRENPLFEKPKKLSKKRIYDPSAYYFQDGGLTQYAPGGVSDGPVDPKKKPPRDLNRILPRWMSDSAIRAIQNTEVGVNPYMSNIQSMPKGMLTGDGSKNYSISRPFYGITTETGLGNRKINRNDSKGWSLGTYVGRPYDDSSGDAYGESIEDRGQEVHDMKWDKYNQDLEAYYAGTMPPSQLNGESYGPDGWTPESAKPKYDGGKLKALGRAMQKSPLVGGLSFNYQHPIIKQPNGYNAGGKGKISLDFDPNNQVGLGLEGGIDFYGGSKRKDYRPGQYKWSINPKLMGSLGTRPGFGAGITAGIEGLPKFMPKNFPGYFHANANYAQSFVLPTPTFSANAGINFPLTDLKKRRAQSKVIQKKEEDGIKNTTYEYGGSTDDYVEIDIPKDQIQKYVDGGYIVEDISVPSLAEGGQPCPKGMIWSSDLGRCISETDYFMNEMRGHAQRVQELKDLGLGEFGANDLDTGALNDIEINRDYNALYNWTGDYMDSPRYKEMVLKSVKGDRKKADELMKARNQNYKNISPLRHRAYHGNHDVLGFAMPWLNQISITREGAEDYDPSVLIHEISHGVDTEPVSDTVLNKRSGRTNIGRLIPGSDIEYITKKAETEKDLKKKGYVPESIKHYTQYISQPTEVRARLNEIREAGNYNGIYDPFKEKVNTKTFNKLKKLNSRALYDLKHIYSDKEIKKMLNTISKNESEPVDEYAPQMAKYGGTTNYQLGDEIDEATMKRLKKLGYTFEEI